MAQPNRLGPSQVFRLEKSIERLEEAGPIPRPLQVVRVTNRGGAHFYVVRSPREIDALQATRSEAERSWLISALSPEKRLAWFHLAKAVMNEGGSVGLYAIREDAQGKVLLEVEHRSGSPTPRSPARKRESAS